jgi:hypothetical protein
MYRDEIIAEVWRNRDAYVKEHHYNLDEIVADLRRRQTKSLSNVVDGRRRGRSGPHATNSAACTANTPRP